MTHKSNYIALYAAVLALLIALAGVPDAQARYTGPLIDAHSQIDTDVELADVTMWARRAGISHIIASARIQREETPAADLAQRYPGCVTAAVGTKSGFYNAGRPEFFRRLDGQLTDARFKAVAEVLLFHAAKGKLAPEVNVATGSAQFQAILKAALARGWPLILHYEMRALGQRSAQSRRERMKELEDLLTTHAAHPMMLIHVGQLDAAEVRELLSRHANLYLLTSHTNSIVDGGSRQPWTNMFEGSRVNQAWHDVILRWPERFVLAFDNVWSDHWSDIYIRQAALWREALGVFPVEVAEAIAFRNAARLWKLPSAAVERGCLDAR